MLGTSGVGSLGEGAPLGVQDLHAPGLSTCAAPPAGGDKGQPLEEEGAWQQLIHIYGPRMRAWCKRMGINADDTSDVFQETCRAVSSNLKNCKPARSVGSFRSWLKTIVRTKTVDHFRRLNQQHAGALSLIHLSEPTRPY